MAWNRVKTRVMIPIDDAEQAAEAIDVAKNFVDDVEHLHVLTVVVPPSTVSPGVLWGHVDTNSIIGGTEKFLREVAEKNSIEAAHVHVRLGSPAHEIVRFAEEEKIELIVISSRGRAGWERVLLGSTAEQVVRRSACEVLVIHPSVDNDKSAQAE